MTHTKESLIKDFENLTGKKISTFERKLKKEAKENFGASFYDIENFSLIYTTNKNYAGKGAGLYIKVHKAVVNGMPILAGGIEVKVS